MVMFPFVTKTFLQFFLHLSWSTLSDNNTHINLLIPKMYFLAIAAFRHNIETTTPV